MILNWKECCLCWNRDFLFICHCHPQAQTTCPESRAAEFDSSVSGWILQIVEQVAKLNLQLKDYYLALFGLHKLWCKMMISLLLHLTHIWFARFPEWPGGSRPMRAVHPYDSVQWQVQSGFLHSDAHWIWDLVPRDWSWRKVCRHLTKNWLTPPRIFLIPRRLFPPPRHYQQSYAPNAWYIASDIGGHVCLTSRKKLWNS